VLALAAWLGAPLAAPASASAPGLCQRVRIPLAPGGLLVREEQGEARGVLVGLMAALQQRLRCPVDLPLLPPGRLVRAFYDTMEADVLIPGSARAYEGHTPHFVPLFQVQVHEVVRAEGPAPGAAPARAAGDGGPAGRGVLARHVTYGADFDALVQRLDAQGRVTWVRDVGTALRMVAARRVDFTLLSPTVTHSYVGAAAYRRYRFRPLRSVRPLETGAAVSRRSLPEAVQQEVVAALRSLVRDGEVQRVFARHFPPEVLALDPIALPRA